MTPLLAAVLAFGTVSAELIGATSENKIGRSTDRCASVLCQEGFECNPSTVCVRAPCIPKCEPIQRRTECGLNESLNECGNHCEPTCDNDQPMCTMMCGPPACQCDSGFVREPMGRCIRKAQCPQVRPARPRSSIRH